LKVATPPLRDAVPIWFAPLKKATVPVGVPLPEAGLTVAVITTGPLEPKVTEAGASAKAVAVAHLVTVKVCGGDVEPEKFVSPLYTAVIEYVPTARLPGL
jgi:hypothetical protein